MSILYQLEITGWNDWLSNVYPPLLSHSKLIELCNITDYCWYVCISVLYMFGELSSETALHPALTSLPLHPLLPIDHAPCLNVVL